MNFKLSCCGNLGRKVSKIKMNSTKICTMLPLSLLRIIKENDLALQIHYLET